jgi:hypothetical protein
MSQSGVGRRILVPIGVAVCLVAAAYAVYLARRSFIRSFFVDGPVAPTRVPRLPIVAAGPALGLGPAARVRVLLIDGLSLSTARALAQLNQHCATGLDLVIDVGFPTVSLPVQGVLWSGLTQQQSGIQYRNALLTPPARATIPARVADSAAVAQWYPYIVHSLGFAQVEPAAIELEPAAGAAWLDSGFISAATAAVRGESRLVFVHVLAVDKAGHKHGRNSAAYREAAAASDELFSRLVAADAARPGGSRSRWFVLSDHGHRDQGGHGGAEPAIRWVRGCVFGDVEPWRADEPPRIHLVDVSRALADALAVGLPAGSAGRPLAVAMAAGTPPRASLPRPSPVRWACAGALLLLGLAAAVWASAGAARRWWSWLVWLPWWWPVAYLTVVAIESRPTLSTPMIYKPLGQTMAAAASPGLALLAVVAALTVSRGPVRLVAAQLALPAALLLASAVLSGAIGLPAEVPPLMPVWTAHTSLFAVLLSAGALTGALVVLASAVRLAFGRGEPEGTSRNRP